MIARNFNEAEKSFLSARSVGGEHTSITQVNIGTRSDVRDVRIAWGGGFKIGLCVDWLDLLPLPALNHLIFRPPDDLVFAQFLNKFGIVSPAMEP